MSNNKQSSVQQFWDKIALKLSLEQINEFIPLFKQAKAMHKEEHRKTYNQGLMSNFQNFEDYYNETFGGNK